MKPQSNTVINVNSGKPTIVDERMSDETVFPGVTIERIHDNRAIVYTIKSGKKTAFAAWSKAALDILEAWPKDQPYLAAHDISNAGLGLLYCTSVQNDIFNIGVLPEARERIQTLLDENPDWQVTLAVVVSASLSGRLAKLLIQEDSPHARIQTKVFFYPEPAQQWLKKQTVNIT